MEPKRDKVRQLPNNFDKSIKYLPLKKFQKIIKIIYVYQALKEFIGLKTLSLKHRLCLPSIKRALMMDFKEICYS